jgi:hypothetical protein
MVMQEDKLTPDLDSENMDPMGDLEKAFNNIDVFPSIEQENRKLKEINRNIQTKLNQTERELAKLKENVNLTCEEMLRIMRDGQEYGHTEDYTEQKRLELKKHYSWKDKL